MIFLTTSTVAGQPEIYKVLCYLVYDRVWRIHPLQQRLIEHARIQSENTRA